jgi:hypothetical protein
MRLRWKRKPLVTPRGYVIRTFHNPDWSPQFKGHVYAPNELLRSHEVEDVNVERVRRACQRWAIQDAERKRKVNNWTEVT